MLKGALLMFSSKNFIVSGLKFRSLIHFEFIFVNDIKKYSNFILLHIFTAVLNKPNNSLAL